MEYNIFSSGLFFFLFIGFLMIYMSLRKHTLARIIYVTLFSLYFYYKSSGLWFGLLVFTATSDFLIAQCISHTTSVLKRKLFVTLSLCINLGMLGYFKYFNFLGELFTMAAGGEWLKMNIFLPVGISFFTFQSISYVIDESNLSAVGSIMFSMYRSFLNWLPGQSFVPGILSLKCIRILR